MSQDDLAVRAKLSQVMIHKLISGKSTKTSKILDLAAALECSPNWLLSEDDDQPSTPNPPLARGSIAHYSLLNIEHDVIRTRRVPLISEAQAGHWTDIKENFRASAAEEWIETTANVSENAFAVRVVGDSMTNPYGTPSIPHGSVVIIDTEIAPTSGKIVLARLENEAKGTLKKLIIDGPNTYLVALNPAYKPISVNGDCTIVGVAKRVEFDL